jgi:hypothetical protein
MKGEFKQGKGVYIARREDGMHGLFAARTFENHEPIIDISDGDKQDESDFYTIEIDRGDFFHPYGRYTNHSCAPTAFVGKQIGILFASRFIELDEEITFDYLASESNIKANFHCNCGASNCVDKIGTDHD